MNTKKLFLNLILALAICPSLVSAQQKAEVYKSSNKFNTMWWLNSVAEPGDINYTFAIQSSDYGMLFNYSDLKVESVWVNDKPMTQAEFLATNHKDIIKESKGAEIALGIMNKNGSEKVALRSNKKLNSCQLHSTGRYAQKRFMNKLEGDPTAENLMSGLELFSYTDFFSLIYTYRPCENVTNKSIYLDFKFPDTYNKVVKKDNYYIVSSSSSKGGFVVYPSKATTKLTVKDNKFYAVTEMKSFHKGDDYEVGIAVYPLIDLAKDLDKFIAGQSAKVKVAAKKVVPSEKKLSPVYDVNTGSYIIKMLTNHSPKGVSNADINEHLDVVITNESNVEQTARLDFFKQKDRLSITGLSGIICDMDGTPTGIPVQITKNWHSKKGFPEKYDHSWMHLYTNVTVPANTTLKFKFKYIAAYWGTLAQASHAQLSIIGWGSTVQLWEQSAVGSWGESICYSPDGNIGNSNLTDVRSSFNTSYDGKKSFTWGGNVGGGDILNITGLDGNRINHENIRIERRRYAPNLSEMTYMGDMAGGAVEFEYTAMLGRTNDMVKGRYHIKMKVVKDIEFKNFAVFTNAAYRYYFGNHGKVAYGNDKGIIREWKAAQGEHKEGFIGGKFVADGNNTWMAQTETTVSMTKPKIPANRGIILRDWNATIGGEKNSKAYWGEYMIPQKFKHHPPKSISMVTTKEGVTSFKAGDYIDATVDFIVFQLSSDRYCGDNQPFIDFLTKNPDSWKMVLREAQQNDVKVKLTTGELTREHPIRIEAKDNMVEGTITGGIAYEPITFTGLSGYRNPTLEIRDGKGEWVKVDQAKQGNDFWQCDFNADTQKWEITYNIPMDRKDYSKARSFRFKLN